MIIKIGIIIHNKSEQAMKVAKLLKEAVQAGEILKADLFSEKLAGMIEKDQLILMEEGDWHRFVGCIRATIMGFETNYLLENDQLKEILQISLDREFLDITVILEKALESECLVLQLPMEVE